MTIEKLGAVLVKRQAEEFTTYNAFVRYEIRAGNL